MTAGAQQKLSKRKKRLPLQETRCCQLADWWHLTSVAGRQELLASAASGIDTELGASPSFRCLS